MLVYLFRDVKPGNILLSKGGEAAKIGDVGFAKFLSNSCPIQPASRTPAGTYDYTAPELLMGQDYSDLVKL